MKSKALLTLCSLVFIFVLSAPLHLLAFQKDFDEVFELDGRLEKSLTVSEGGFLRVKNVTGQIEIQSWNKNEILITAYERRNRDNDGIAKVLIEQRGNRVIVETEYDKYSDRRDRRDRYWRSGRSYPSVEYRITVPERFEIEAENVTGSVTVENINGEVKSETVTGSVEVENVTGRVYAKTTTGRVRLYKVDGPVEAKTTTGSVRIYNCSIPDLRARTTTGSLDIETSTINEQGNYDLSTTTGSVTFGIPSDAKASVRIRFRGNNFRSDFDLRDDDDRDRDRDDRSSRRYYDYGRNWRSRTIVDDINGGGARINMEASNGRVELRKIR